MAFLIPDNIRSRKDIPAPLKRVAGAFMTALDDDVFVWFEPLYDPAGDKPHFVLLIPSRGVVVLEVLDANAKTFLGVFRGKLRFNRDGREIATSSPLDRANAHAEAIRSRINAEPRLEGLGLRVAAGAVFPNLSSRDAEDKGIGKIVPPGSSIFKETIDAAIQGSGEAALLRAFIRMVEGAEVELSDNEIKVLRGIIQPEIVIDRVAGDEKGASQLSMFGAPTGGHDDDRVLDHHQESIAKSLGDGHRVVRGVAGSGKTLILTYRAKLVAQASPRKRFLVTCYTKTLASQLRAALQDLPNVDVEHLDGLMGKAIRFAGLRNPGYKKDPTGEQVALTALQALEKAPQLRYDGIFLDEAQDFGTTALRFVVGLLRNESSDLVVVADAAQNIFRRRFSWKQAGIHAQGRTRILRVNYRNTKEILEFAYRFLTGGSLREEDVPDFEDESSVIPPQSAQRSGPPPEVQLVSSGGEAVRAVAEKVKSWLASDRSPRSIAILYASSQGEVMKNGLYDQLRYQGIEVFWATNPFDKTARDRLAEASAPVILSTIHSAKGLEFPRVVVCELGREDDDLETARKLAYVGMTRATNELCVVTTTSHPLAPDLLPKEAKDVA